MNLVQLEYYVAAIECGSYAQAGKAYFVSPQAISRAVKDLEKELGVQLFLRGSNSISPTPLGLTFAAKAREILSSIRDLITIAKNSAGAHQSPEKLTIAVGIQPFRGCAFDSNHQKELNRLSTEISITHIFNTDEYCLTALDLAIVDAAIIVGRIDKKGFVCTKLCEADLRLMMWNDNLLAKEPFIEISNLDGALLARPYNLKTTFNAIDHLLGLKDAMPIYCDVFPSYKAHVKFMRNSHGIIFTCGDLSSSYEDEVVFRKVLRPYHISLPICLVHNEECNNFLATIAAAYHPPLTLGQP